MEKREVKKQLQLVEGIMKEDLYTAYYAVSEDEEIVRDKEIEIPGMDECKDVAEVEVTKTANIKHIDTGICGKEDFSEADGYSDIEKEQADLYVVESREVDDGNSEQIYAGERKTIEDEVAITQGASDKAQRIADRLSACGAYANIDVAVKTDIFGLDIADVSGSIRLFSDVIRKLGIRLAGDEFYEEFQRIYDESVGRDAGKEKAEDKVWNRGRGR